jgi:hypothetical protein
MLNEWGNCVTPEGVPTFKCLEVVFGNILTMAGAFFVLVLFIMLIVGAFNYLTSFGNPEKVKKAQGTFRLALIGFFLFLGSYLILNMICFLFLGGIGSECKLFKFEIGP